MARHSPVMLIQRWIRGWLIRKALMQSKDPKIKLVHFYLILLNPIRVDRNIACKSVNIVAMSKSLCRALVGRRLGVASGSIRERRSSIKKTLPPLPTFNTTRKRIAAEVPTTTGSRSPRKRKGKSSTPPPPPTTPKRNKNQPLSRSVETHILGIDHETSQLKYSMHIDLNKLQEVVIMAEQSEPQGVNKTFKKAFLTKTSSQHKQNASSMVPDEEKTKKEVMSEKLDSKSINEAEGDESFEDNIELTGQTAKVFTHNELPNIATTKIEDGKALRAVEKEISETVAKIRQPPQPIRELRPKPLGKEHHSFTRAYATMNLSALRSIEKVHEAKKKEEELARKANLVSKIKQERDVRRAKIEEHQRSMRENILEWKSDEMQRLEEAQLKQKKQHQADVMKQSQVRDDGIISAQRQLEDQEFASEFGRQNTLVGGTLSKEDRKSSKESVHSKTRERVQQARKISLEQQELVKKYMESRRAQLIREGTEIKRELDIKTLEAVSQRLMDAKRKVAKETARKEAARVTIAALKEELRCGPRGPGEQRPGGHGNVVRRDSDEDVQEMREAQLKAFAKKQSENNSPSHIRRMSFEAHNTWQRGVKAMEEAAQNGSHHFPILPASSRSAIMYEMMAPGPVLRSQEVSPLTSSKPHSDHGNNTSANSSMLISNYQTVR